MSDKERFQLRLTNKAHWQDLARKEGITLTELIETALSEYDASVLPIPKRWTAVEYGLMNIISDLDCEAKERTLTEAEAKYRSISLQLYEIIQAKRLDIPRGNR